MSKLRDVAPRALPTSFTATALLAALVLPFTPMFGLAFGARAAVGVCLVASPFAILLWGHGLVRGGWKRHTALALANVPLVVLWHFATFLMWYMRPGLLGAAVMGGALALLAAIYLLLVRRVGMPASEGTPRQPAGGGTNA